MITQPVRAATWSQPSGRLLRFAFAGAAAAFAWLRLSDNTADNDLWGHVLYGERALALGGTERVDTLSWTAAGQPWINHEALAERVLGWTHEHGGGPGLWLLMIAVALATVGWATRLGAGRETAQRWTAVALLAASVNFIALGFAVRPQLFTLFALVALLAVLGRFLAGGLNGGLALPPLFALWANFHGGFLAGLLVLVVAATAEIALQKVPRLAGVLPFAPPPWRPGAWRIAAIALVSVLAVALNPWGLGLLEWTIGSVRLPRPQITEWQPMHLVAGNLAFFIVLGASAAAWIASRRPRRLWEAATLVLLASMALASRRHAPLFGLANLILTPRHLSDALDRLAPHAATLVRWYGLGTVRVASAIVLLAAGVLCGRQSVTAPREHPWTIEVPRDEYPTAALTFLREHGMTGNTITFFDWGQQALWELPDNPVSFDGRLDTVYPADVRDAHWDLYAGRRLAPALSADRAVLALLPTASDGVDLLAKAGWKQVYRDALATVLARNPASFRGLAGLTLPVRVGAAATRGRDPFPDAVPGLARPDRPR